MKRILSMIAAAAITLLATRSLAVGVGFAKLAVPDGANPAIEVGVWYPTLAAPRPIQVGLFPQDVAPDAPLDGTRRALVVISHGHGGDFAGHSDTALALARAGFVVAAPTHTGDNDRDESRGLDMADRTRQLGVVVDYMTTRWRPGAVDVARVGAFGFSAGGFTVLALAGGEPDLARIGAHCAVHPEFYDCALVAGGQGLPVPTTGFAHRPLRAIVVAAPALGFTFTRASLRGVDLPVQLWRAQDDAVLPHPFYAEAVRLALPHPPEMHLVEHAGHYDFLAPCPPALAAIASPICTSAAVFDRARFHAAFNLNLVRFFQSELLAPRELREPATRAPDLSRRPSDGFRVSCQRGRSGHSISRRPDPLRAARGRVKTLPPAAEAVSRG